MKIPPTSKQPTWAHAHFPGGGMWILSATVPADMLHFIIDPSVSPLIGPTSFSDYYHSFSGVSAGSMVVSGILLPERLGEKQPLYRHFGPVRDQLMEDSPTIFDIKKQKGFVLRKVFNSAVGNIADDLARRIGIAEAHIDHVMQTVLPDETHPQSTISNLSHKLRNTKDQIFNWMQRSTFNGLHTLGDWAVEKTHFPHENLQARLRERLQTFDRHHQMRPACMSDLIKPCIIPSIKVNPDDNSYLSYIATDDTAQSLLPIPERFRDQFLTDAKVADAVFFSSLLSPLFKTGQSQAHGPQTDGGSFYNARVAMDNLSPFYPRSSARYLNIFECNMSNHPANIVPQDLERSSLAIAVGANMIIQKNARRQSDYAQIIQDPRTKMMVEFSRSACPAIPAPLHGQLREQLEIFSIQYCKRDYTKALEREIPYFSSLSQAATSPDTHQQFIDAGLQTTVRMLPELVQTAKELIRHGPLSQKLSPMQQEFALRSIDQRFSPTDLELLKHLRQSALAGQKTRPKHNDFIYFGDQSSEQQESYVRLDSSHQNLRVAS